MSVQVLDRYLGWHLVTCVVKTRLSACRFFLGGVSGDLRGFQFKGVGPCDFRRPRENDNEVIFNPLAASAVLQAT